jgi:molybdate transport system substrate-binding protein
MATKLLAPLIVGACVLMGMATSAFSAEITIFTSRAITTVLEVVGPQFERNSGHRLRVVTGLSSELVRRINAGERFDVLGAPPPLLDGLIKQGKLIADTRTLVGQSDVGVEVRAGAPKPDISTIEAFKQTLSKAKSITYLGVPGVPQMLERLGIANDIKHKTTIPDTDIVSELVAKGEVELGIVVLTQILTTPGVELVGTLPSEIKVTSSFGAAVSTRSEATDAARALLKFLHSDDAKAVIRKQGMEPLS